MGSEDFNKVWKISDYGNLDALAGKTSVVSSGQSLLGTGLTTGISTVNKPGNIKPTTSVQSAAQNLLNDPTAFVAEEKAALEKEDPSLLDRGKSMLSSIFNTDDEADLKIGPVPLGGVESVWDGMLRAFNWGYDRLGRLEAAAISAAPGGIQTLTWDQTEDVSPGQAFVASMGVSAGKLKRGEGNIGDVLSTGPLGIFGSMLSPDSALQKKDYDITTAEGQAVFDSGPEKFFSGLSDAAISIFADPLIVAGKATKLARLKYVDRSVEANKQAILDELAAGRELSIAGNTKDMAPTARFLHDAITPDSSGLRMAEREIAERDEVRFSGDAYGISSALATVRNGDYITGELVMRAGFGDATAFSALAQRSAIAADALATAKRTNLEMQIAQDPNLYASSVHKYSLRSDKAFQILQDAKKSGASPQILKAAEKEFDDSVDALLAIERGVSLDPMALPTQEAMAWMSAVVKEASIDNQYFARAMNDTIFGSFVQADRGFASDTLIGKAVSARRAKRARNRYERKSTSGQGVFAQDFFGASKFRRTIRLLARTSDETPAYYVAYSGAGAVDQGREMGAFFDSLSMYGGQAREFVNPKTGQVESIGGINRKNELFSEYTASLARNDDTSAAVEILQNKVKDDMVRYYGVDQNVVDHLYDTAFKKQKALEKDIRESEHGYFTEDNKVLNVAPFLKSQLSQGTYLLPFDYLEKVFINVAKGKIKDPAAGSILTPSQWTAEKALNANRIFQDFWRPAVLFRLGYPQRNVAEGLFRSMAFNESFAPLAWAAKGALYGAENFRRAQKATKKIKKAEKSLENVYSVDRTTFDNLVAEQGALQEGQQALNRAKSQMQDAELIYARDTTAPKPEFLESPVGYTTADEKFQVARVQQKAKGPATFTKQDGKYVSDSGTIEKIGSRWVATAADGSEIGQFKTLTDAKANFLVDTDQFVTKWRVNEMSATPGNFVAGTKLFDSAEEAQAALEQSIERAFKSEQARSSNPQLVEIARGATEAKARTPKSFTDPVTGKVYKNAAEIDAELATIKSRLGTINKDIEKFGGRPIPPALNSTKLQKWRDKQIAALEGQIRAEKEFLDDVKASLGPKVSVDEQAHIDFLENVMQSNKTKMIALERDDSFALTEFANQAGSRRIADNGSRVVVGGVVLNSAFSNPRYRDIAHLNMSSDNTVKATLSARLQLSESIIYRKKIENYVDVSPDQGDRYWAGMESMLRQYAQDPMGKMIVRGSSDEQIALWLLRDPEGQKVRDSLDAAWEASKEGAGAGPRIGDNIDSASDFVKEVRLGLETITAGNRSVWKILESRAPKADELKKILTGDPRLANVVGYKDVVNGFKTTMDSYRTITQKAFQFIGTMPEDALVRAPFYSARYVATRDELINIVNKQFDKETEIPIRVLDAIEKQAHRRALKDTKDFLYTIDRRTNLGKYGELITPFISATQNSVTSVGRLVRRDPALPGMLLLLWSAPSKVGWEDKNGNLIIPLPHDLIPDGVEDFFGIAGMKNMTINKASLNVIFPESGFAFVPRPAPLAQVAASEIMKKGLFGVGVEAPSLMVNILGKKDAEALWGGMKKYTFGEESSISTEAWSYDKVTPPVFNKFIQYMQKDGSKQYGYQYGLQARTQDLLWRAGEREEPATAAEITSRTNGMFLLRMLGNMFAFTPPNYDSPLAPLMDIQKTYDQVYGLEGPMKFSQTFGNEMLALADTATTENVGGTTINTDTVRNIKNNADLIRNLTPTLGDDLDVLGILVNGDPKESAYDVNAYQWLTNENIPGTSRRWREINTGAESMAETQRQAGWVEYIKFKGQIDALLQQRGLKSYRVKGAEDLNQYRKEFIDNMLSNPLYAGWAVDYQSTGSSKTYSAVNTITQALRNEKFMSDKADNKTWQFAADYIEVRNRLIQMVKESGVSLENDANAALKEEWDGFRQDLISRDIGWAGIANRYLNGDDTPVEIGTTFNDIGATNG